MTKKLPITVARGDGIGPEIMDVVLNILTAAGANLEYEHIVVGEKSYLSGSTSGISAEAWEIIKRNRIFLKAPITTPQGGGYKSLNVTIRKSLKQFANVRPCRSYAPCVKTHFPKLDTVIVRENEEDLYAGIEYRQTNNAYHAVKLLTRTGTERIIRHAFEYAVLNNRKKVTCMTKDNIMKICDGMFHEMFNGIAKEYPQIENEHYIIDIGTARIAHKPEIFDVIVTENLYGDIISDVVAEVSGSVGLAGSGNIGQKYSMFEAIHGSAPTIAGQNKANPTGLLNGAIMMLKHVGQGSIAAKIENSLLYTLESGVVTYDIFQEGISVKKVGTKEFGDEIIKNIGKIPAKFAVAKYQDFEFDNNGGSDYDDVSNPSEFFGSAKKKLVGADVFVHAACTNSDIAQKLKKLNCKLQLSTIASRGLTVYPVNTDSKTVSDHWVCRFVADDITNSDILQLLNEINAIGVDFIKTESLYEFDGIRSYSLGQGE